MEEGSNINKSEGRRVEAINQSKNKKMSSCGSGCSCGSDCKCGSGCKCGMYPDLGVTERETLIVGVAVAPSPMMYESMSEGGHGCSCGANCKCDPCTCK